MTLHSLDEVAKKFLSYTPSDMTGQYSLDRIRILMGYLGNPQEHLRVIHIAGTSGKTSTAYFIRGFLEAAGRKTGLTVSPHIVAINERVQIGGIPLAEKLFLQYADQFITLIDKSDIHPTYFELCVAFAYWVFAKEKVDYAVIETGLGGLHDGTNVVSRPDKVCIITDIGLDHTKTLGNTIELIAAQKAGIIQPGNTALIRKQSSEILQVFKDRAAQQGATLKIVSDTQSPAELPNFQHHNWTLAKALYSYIAKRDRLPVLSVAAEKQIMQQAPPGRWEIYSYKNKKIILDGAHNPQKLQALCQSFDKKEGQSIAVLANLIKAPEEKAVSSLKAIRPIISTLIIPEFFAGQIPKSRQSFSASYMERIAEAQGFNHVITQPDLVKAFHLLLDQPEETLLITGSLYIVSQLRPLLIELC